MWNDNLNNDDLEILEGEFIFPDDTSEKRNKKRFSIFHKRGKSKKGKNEIKEGNPAEDDIKNMNLTQAYSLLDIKVFPVSYEDVRMAYYMQELSTKNETQKVELLKRARKLIFDNININPFEQGDTVTEFLEETNQNESKIPSDDILLLDEEVSEETAKVYPLRNISLHFKNIFRKKKKVPKLKWDDVEKEINNLPKETHGTTGPLKKENRKGKKSAPKLHVIKFVLLISVVLGLVYIVYQSDTDSNNKDYGIIDAAELEQEASQEEENSEVSDATMTLEKSLQLLEKDGLTIDKEKVTFNRETLTDYSCVQLLRVPLLNISVIRREFDVNLSYIAYRVCDYSLYKFKGSNEPKNAWKHIFNHADYKVTDYELSGTWKGECITGKGKYELSNVTLTLNTTENGYMTAEFKFLSELKLPGKLLMEGIYDNKNNTFVLQEKEWIQRPKLFVAPQLHGRIDLDEKRLTQTAGETKVTFNLENTSDVQDSALITNDVATSLLKTRMAVYEQWEISLSSITSCNITDIKNETDHVLLSVVSQTQQNMVNYNIKGTITVKERNGIWTVTDSNLQAVPINKDFCGTYKGSEIIGKQTYRVKVEISKSASKDHTYKAVVSRRYFLIPYMFSKEIWTITENIGMLTCERTDVLKGKIKGESLNILEIDYSQDLLYNSNFHISKKER